MLTLESTHPLAVFVLTPHHYKPHSVRVDTIINLLFSQTRQIHTESGVWCMPDNSLDGIQNKLVVLWFQKQARTWTVWQKNTLLSQWFLCELDPKHSQGLLHRVDIWLFWQNANGGETSESRSTLHLKIAEFGAPSRNANMLLFCVYPLP